ncbi:MAG: CHAT domain-containing protein [Caldilineales bacterium]
MPDQDVWRTYRDFIVRIEDVGESRYRVRARTFDDREASATFEAPFGEKDLKIFLLTVGQPRRTVRRGRVPQPMRETVDFGQALFRAVMADDVGQLFASARHDAFMGNYGLRLQLRLSGAPRLGNLPWEFLFDGRDFLALQPDTPVVRYLDLERPPRPMAVAPPLNMLVTVSAPSDLQQIDADEERDKLHDALHEMDPDKRPRIEFTPDAQLSTLQRTLRRARANGRPFHIWHYIGHGGYDPDQRSSFLVMTTRSGAPEPVDGFQLGTLFGGYPEMRLAVLNACEGARTDNEDPFAGVAAALVEKGIPAVIAMQFEISDEVAARLSAEFYAALADGLPVDAALTEARRAVFFMPNKLEWATPVLFMRTPDGRLFDLSEPAPAMPARPRERRPAPPAVDPDQMEQLWVNASAAYYTENWAEAIEFLERIVAVDSGYRTADRRLEKARHMLRCSALYEDGCRAMDQQEWSSAVPLLSQVADIDSNFRDVQNRLNEARRQVRLTELYEEAVLLSRAGRWDAVAPVFQRLHALAPDYPDPDGLEQRASAELEAESRRRQAEQHYRAGIAAIDRGDWQAGERSFHQVQQVSPGYEATEALLQRVARELEAANPPRLVAYLTAEPDVIEAGASLTWSLQIHNAGQADLRNVKVVRDGRVVKGPLSLTAGEAQTLTFTSTFTAAGEKTRTLSVTGKTARGVEVTAEAMATATVRAQQAAPRPGRVSASVTITPDARRASAGQQVRWTITVRNDGEVELRRLRLERDSRLVETFSLAPGQSREFTSQSRYTTPGVKEKVATIAATAGGQRIFEVASGSLEVVVEQPAHQAARLKDTPGAVMAPAETFREYLKSVARDHDRGAWAQCPICEVDVTFGHLVQHYDKVHWGQSGPVPSGFSPPKPSPPRQKKPAAPDDAYRDRLKQFARDHRGEMVACPVCGVPVSTGNILRHYDRQHPGAVGSDPVAGSAPSGSASHGAQAAPSPALSPAAAYREELKSAVKEFGQDDYVYCPLCETTLKASSLIRHYDKVHPGEYRT